MIKIAKEWAAYKKGEPCVDSLFTVKQVIDKGVQSIMC
jgi:hypothetical protein